MPEYLAPGVYVEEVSFRSKSIEGVSTTTTGLIGAARYGPIDLVPDIITSVGEFERVYGDRQQLNFDPNDPNALIHNYLWHAVRAFFEEGGKRLYIVRAFSPYQLNPDGTFVLKPDGTLEPGTYRSPDDTSGVAPLKTAAGLYEDGHARISIGKVATDINIRARYPGSAGNMRVRFTLRLGQNVLGITPATPSTPAANSVKSLLNNDVVLINDVSSPIASPPGSGAFYLATRYFDTTTKAWNWRFVDTLVSPENTLELADLTPDPDPTKTDNVRVVTLTVTVTPTEPNSIPLVWDNIPLDPTHQRAGALDSLSAYFAANPSDLASARSLPIVITLSNPNASGLDVLQALLDTNPSVSDALLALLSNDPKARTTSTDVARSIDLILDGGNDGLRPTADAYEGTAPEEQTTKTGLKAFEDIDDISIIAAPGSTFNYEGAYHDDASTIISLLIDHATLMRYRIAVLDSGNGQSISQVRALRAKIDSTYAALYYPWIRILDPVTRAEIFLPPSGFVAGIYARNDINRAVYKAPANEVVNLALGFEILLNKAQQDVLNPEGINCFRFFEGRGFRLWGARTISSDPEWKYVNLRRYFAYLEHSIDKGTQFAVFEPNGEALWANVRRTIEDFLLNEWQSGALLGDKPEKAYFVRCDRSTMTQNDLDNGRLICLIGVAPLRPAEFVIFRIGQWTADRRG